MGKETFLNSPLGLLKIVYNESALEEILFLDQVDEQPGPVEAVGSAAALPTFVSQLAAELEAYFKGKLHTFSVPINLDRGTAFQRQVWQALLAIPYGKTVTYGELARSLGLSAGASRAVGHACGANPLPIIVPCHRVVAANGSLGGYSGGLWRKEGLLKVERQ